MKITQLAAQPQLVKITIDDAATVEQWGESIEFWTWDRQPFDVFMKIASAGDGNTAQIMSIVKDLILDEEGKPAIVDGTTLPNGILMAAIAKITEMLGK